MKEIIALWIFIVLLILTAFVAEGVEEIRAIHKTLQSAPTVDCQDEVKR